MFWYQNWHACNMLLVSVVLLLYVMPTTSAIRKHPQYVEQSYTHAYTTVTWPSYFSLICNCIYNLTIKCHFSLWDSRYKTPRTCTVLCTMHVSLTVTCMLHDTCTSHTHNTHVTVTCIVHEGCMENICNTILEDPTNAPEIGFPSHYGVGFVLNASLNFLAL